MSQIEHYAIYASDPTALKNFYAGQLGMRVIQDNSSSSPPGFFLADESGAAIEIIGRPAGEPVVNQRFVCHVAFQVENFARAKAALELAGVRFETDTAVANEAVQTAFFCDPEGNRCQIVWRKRALGT
jgi:glyoxylase I family protein